MKLSVATFGKFVFVHLFISQFHQYGVSAVKIDIHTFLPDTLRKAKQGLNKVLRRSPLPPVLVIPQRTGIASIDEALFQTSLIGKTMKTSLLRQFRSVSIREVATPNLFMLFLSIVPACQLDHLVSSMLTAVATVEQTTKVMYGVQYLQMMVRVLVSSQMLQIVSVTLKDAVMTHASIVNPTVLKVIETIPTAIRQIAILTLLAHGLMKFYNAVVRPFFRKESSTSTVSISPITTGDNEFMATFTPIHFSDDESVVVTDIAAEAEFTTLPVATETTKEDKAFEVNVTKISAVLDRFESKILSLVGGTRFHPSPSILAEDEIEAKHIEVISSVEMEESVMTDIDSTTNDSIEVSDDDQDKVTNREETHNEETVDSERSVTNDKKSSLSLKPYEITLSSPLPASSTLWSILTTPSSKAAVRAFGVIASALFSVNVLPPMVRHAVAVFAALFILGMLVQEIRGAFSTHENTDALDSLIHDIEERTLSYTNEMEPLVVASRHEEVEPTATHSSLRFWRTRLPILDGIAHFSSQLISSRNNAENENVDECEIKEEEETADASFSQFESDVHFYNEAEQDAQPEVTTSPPKNVWRWMSPVYSQPKMTRTACTAIVGM